MPAPRLGAIAGACSLFFVDGALTKFPRPRSWSIVSRTMETPARTALHRLHTRAHHPKPCRVEPIDTGEGRSDEVQNCGPVLGRRPRSRPTTEGGARSSMDKRAFRGDLPLQEGAPRGALCICTLHHSGKVIPSVSNGADLVISNIALDEPFQPELGYFRFRSSIDSSCCNNHTTAQGKNAEREALKVSF